MKRATLAVAFILLPVLALAQPGPGGGRDGLCPVGEDPGFGPGGGPGFGPGGPGGPGDGPGFGPGGPLPGEGRRAHKMIEAFRLYRLTEYLELDEEQTAKIYPKLAAMQKEREEHMTAVQEKLDELGTMLDAEKVQADKAAALAREIHAMRDEHQKRMQSLQADLMNMLSDEQLAKYTIFESRFQRHLNRVARRVEEFRDDETAMPRGMGRRGR